MFACMAVAQVQMVASGIRQQRHRSDTGLGQLWLVEVLMWDIRGSIA